MPTLLRSATPLSPPPQDPPYFFAVVPAAAFFGAALTFPFAFMLTLARAATMVGEAGRGGRRTGWR